MTTTPTSTTPAATAAPTDLLKAKEIPATGLLQGQNSRQTRMDAGFDPATSAPDLLSAAQCVLNNIESKHRPPKRDMYGTMAYVRVDVLAQLADAVAAAPAAAIAQHKRMVELAGEVADARAQHKRDRADLAEVRELNSKLKNKLLDAEEARLATENRLLVRVGLGPAPHPDDLAVDAFATAMKEKLAACRAKGRSGWDDPARCDVGVLAEGLVAAVDKGDPVDVANFAMMLHLRQAGADVLADALHLHVQGIQLSVACAHVETAAQVAAEVAGALAQTRAVFSGAPNAFDILEYLGQVLRASGVDLPALARTAATGAAEVRTALFKDFKAFASEINTAVGEMPGAPAAAPDIATTGRTALELERAEVAAAAMRADSAQKMESVLDAAPAQAAAKPTLDDIIMGRTNSDKVEAAKAAARAVEVESLFQLSRKVAHLSDALAVSPDEAIQLLLLDVVRGLRGELASARLSHPAVL